MMLKVLIFLSSIASWTVLANNESRPVTTVPELNLELYLGKWYQIAAIPAWFQRNCEKNTTAFYSKSEDGLIKVENSCQNEKGEISQAIGRARINPTLNSPSKLEVTFVNFLAYWVWAFGGDYWIMDLEKREGSYEYSVVGNPTRDYLWVLARKPQLDLEELKPIRDKIKAQLYELDKIIITQEGELNGKMLSTLGLEAPLQ